MGNNHYQKERERKKRVQYVVRNELRRRTSVSVYRRAWSTKSKSGDPFSSFACSRQTTKCGLQSQTYSRQLQEQESTSFMVSIMISLFAVWSYFMVSPAWVVSRDYYLTAHENDSLAFLESGLLQSPGNRLQSGSSCRNQSSARTRSLPVVILHSVCSLNVKLSKFK